MFKRIRYLLLQVRNDDDPMREHEVASFARVLDTTPDRIGILDILNSGLSRRLTAEIDMFLLGGSGHYSAAGEGDWLERALNTLREVHASDKPTFASCWGFQALARAMGGEVIKDLSRAEVGTHHLTLTTAGRSDPVFGPMGDEFRGQMGHEDCVIRLPPETTLLASSARVENQAYRFDNAPIYCTQFHPELNCSDLMLRLQTYPEYIERIAGRPVEDFVHMIHETIEAESLIKRFVALMFGD